MAVKKSIFKKIARLLMKSGMSRFFRIKRDGFVLRFYPSSLSRVLWVEQFTGEDRCHEDCEFFSRYLRPGDTVVDVGANIGLLSLTASRLVGEQGWVYAFEPHPRVYEYLLGNIALNRAQNIRAFNAALGDTEGTVRFADRSRGDDRSAVATDDQGTVVPCHRLDRFDLPVASLALLKIDVEGYEKFVVQGAESLRDKVSCIYFEAIESNLGAFGYTLRELLDLLTSHGFHILEVSMNEARVISPSEYTGGSSNLVAVRDVNALLSRTGFCLKPFSNDRVGA
ncbi:MAG: FkbM family methyltransferase [Planctomycetota bacterium]|nr:FkbM family methyltransferase [Planctomycetota bacterium]